MPTRTVNGDKLDRMSRRSRLKLFPLFLFVALAGLWAATVANGSSALPAAGQTAALQNDDLFVNSGQSLGNGSSFSLAIGDLDGDGYLDAFVANGAAGGEANEVWLNNGLGFFSPNGQSLGSAVSDDVALGDVNGNGDLDAVVAEGIGATIWLNNGAGQFSDSGQFLGVTGSSVAAVALGDLDGDGDLDMVLAGNGPNTVWLNNGAGQFSDSGQRLGSEQNHSVVLVDLNGSGYLDMVVTGPNPARVWFNDGNGQFADSGQALSAGESWQAALADLNDNGFVDIFLAKSGANEVWLNDGNGFFADSGQRLGTAVSFGVSLADLTGNGGLDAFVANFGADKVWLNDGSGQFSDSGQNLGGALDFSAGVGLADLNGSGRADAFVAGDGPNQVWLNQGPALPPPSGADLAVTVVGEKYRDLQDSHSQLAAFTVTVHNHGPELATGVTVQGLSQSYNFSNGSQGQCVSQCEAWLFGDLASGQSATVTYGPVPGFPFTGGAIKYSAIAQVSVTAMEPDPDPSNNRSVFTTYFFDCGGPHCSLEWLFCRVEMPQWFTGSVGGIQKSGHVAAASPSAAGWRDPSSLRPLLRPLAENVIDLAVYYLVRDGVLMGTAKGQHYVDLFYAHESEISALLQADAELEAQAIATLQLWEPNLWALVTGQGGNASITAGQVAAIDNFLTNLAAVAGPELQQVIAAERTRLGPPEDYVGMTMSEARGLIVGYGLRLPFIVAVSKIGPIWEPGSTYITWLKTILG
jgi:hypothetical protein